MLHFFYHWLHHDYIQTVQHWMGTDTGYLVMFGLLLACGLGLPLPEDIPLMLAGFFIADGRMNLVIAAVAGWCGIIGGDCILYSLGRRFGMNVTKIPVIGSHVSVERIEYAHGLFEKYGVWVVAVGRLFAGIRGAMVIAAGTLRFNFVKFIVADGLAAVVSGGLFIALGFWGRRKFGDLTHIQHDIEHYQRYVLIAILLAVAGLLIWKFMARKATERRGFETISTDAADSNNDISLNDS